MFHFFIKIFFVSSGDHIVPNFEEIWPSDKNKDDKYKRRLIGMEYYMDVSTSIYGHESVFPFINRAAKVTTSLKHIWRLQYVSCFPVTIEKQK